MAARSFAREYRDLQRKIMDDLAKGRTGRGLSALGAKLNMPSMAGAGQYMSANASRLGAVAFLTAKVAQGTADRAQNADDAFGVAMGERLKRNSASAQEAIDQKYNTNPGMTKFLTEKHFAHMANTRTAIDSQEVGGVMQFLDNDTGEAIKSREKRAAILDNVWAIQHKPGNRINGSVWKSKANPNGVSTDANRWDIEKHCDWNHY